MSSNKYMNERIKILFVDDMPVCCRYFMKGLSGKYAMHWAMDRKEALRQIKKENYDLVVTDYHLGDEAPEGGLDVIMKAYNENIPVISISKENHRNEALDSGANRFVFKKEFFGNVKKIISDVLTNGK